MLGKEIKLLREKAKISIEDLAFRSNISVEILSRLENGDIRQLPVPDLLRVNNNLGMKSAREFVKLMHLNKYHEDFKIYSVGVGKTGTLSIAGIFGNYRSQHQFVIHETLMVIKQFEKNEITYPEFRDFILKRDRLGGLQLDSSGHNFFYMDILADALPSAKFLFVIRDCYSWLDSVVNMLHLPHSGFGSPKFEFEILESICKDEKKLRRNLCRYIDVPLGFWAWANRMIVEKLPPSRSLIIRSHEISQSLDKLAHFAGVPVGSLIAARRHANKGRCKLGILHQVDHDFLEAKFREHTEDLMANFFPGYDLRAFLEGKPIPKHPLYSKDL